MQRSFKQQARCLRHCGFCSHWFASGFRHLELSIAWECNRIWLVQDMGSVGRSERGEGVLIVRCPGVNRLHALLLIFLGVSAGLGLQSGLAPSQEPWAAGVLLVGAYVAARSPFIGLVLTSQNLTIRGYLWNQTITVSDIRSFVSISNSYSRLDPPGTRALAVLVEKESSPVRMVPIGTVRQLSKASMGTAAKLNQQLASYR